MSVDLKAISVESTLYGHEVQYGGPRTFQFEHREHAECLAAALRLQRRKTVPLKQVLEWRLPLKPEGCRKLLDLLSDAREESRRLAAMIASAEDELNEIVHRLYEITPAERDAIEGFLDRYSSHPPGLDSDVEEEEDLPRVSG